MTMTNIFNNDAFSVTTLTDAIKDTKIRPGRLGEMGLFTTSSVVTLSVAIERIGDFLQIVAPTPRGAPGEVRDDAKRTLEDISIPHFQRDWAVYADEVQSRRDFGDEGRLTSVQSKVAERITLNLEDLDLIPRLFDQNP